MPPMRQPSARSASVNSDHGSPGAGGSAAKSTAWRTPSKEAKSQRPSSVRTPFSVSGSFVASKNVVAPRAPRLAAGVVERRPRGRCRRRTACRSGAGPSGSTSAQPPVSISPTKRRVVEIDHRDRHARVLVEDDQEAVVVEQRRERDAVAVVGAPRRDHHLALHRELHRVVDRDEVGALAAVAARVDRLDHVDLAARARDVRAQGRDADAAVHHAEHLAGVRVEQGAAVQHRVRGPHPVRTDLGGQRGDLTHGLGRHLCECPGGAENDRREEADSQHAP